LPYRHVQQIQRGRCQGCHVFTSHHQNRGWYRFLKAHGTSPTLPISPSAANEADYVKGYGDADWEQTNSTVKHNWYKGVSVKYTTQGTKLATHQSITSFCAGCHSAFHDSDEISGEDGYKSPWLRHPTDILIWNKGGEYTGRDYKDAYSVEAPVAWTNIDAPTKETAVVMCLSCHRPHGSPYKDLLRWDYSTMIAGGGGSGGCFTCHTTKD
jgi:predicted CXXCH cytochrome family protein